MTAKLHQTHRLLQPQMFNAFANTFLGNKGLGGLAVHVNISMSVRSVARQDLMRLQRKFRGGGSSWGGDIFAHKSSFARPTDVELRSKVVRDTMLSGLDASFRFQRSELPEMP